MSHSPTPEPRKTGYRPFTVQMVGQPAQPLHTVDAYSGIHAVAQVAGCDVMTVGLPIWRQGPDRRGERYEVECYMPLDGSGRQWLVRE